MGLRFKSPGVAVDLDRMYGVPFTTLVLFALGLVWCRQMLRRVRDDLATLKSSEDNAERAAIAGLWVVTLAIGMWMFGTTLGIARGILFVTDLVAGN
jgi:hypothetical protein